MRVLVLALDGIGDLVLRQPLLGGLSDAGADVTVLVQAGHEEAVALVEPRARAVPAVLSWSHVPSTAEFRTLLADLRTLEPELLVSAQFDPVCYANWVVRAFADVPAAGFDGGSEQKVEGWQALEIGLALPPRRALETGVTCRPETHEHEKARALVEALTHRPWTPPRPVLDLSGDARRRAQEVLEERGLASGDFVACCPAGTKNVTIKAWPAERFADVLAMAGLEHGLPALVMGHVTEAERVEDVAARVRARGGRAEAWLGSRGDLTAVAGLLGRARLYLGNDTGAMHVAAGLDRPVIAICGGGHWPRFLPLAAEGAVHTLPLPCFGCGWRDCFFGDGPCVSAVTTEAVRGSLRAVLGGPMPLAVHHEAAPPAETLWTKAVGAFRAAVHEPRAETSSATQQSEMLVSIITPSLNGAASIEETLESVRAQRHPAIEHLVVDGGSTDGTLEILARSPGVSWTTAADRGMYDAINRGLGTARGEILAYQNSDDRYAGPDAVALAVEAFRAHPDVDVVYGDFRYVDEAGRVLEEVRAPEFDLARLRRYNFVPPHSTFVRRRVVHERGYWLDPALRFAGDWDWCLRMALGGCRFLHLPHILSEFRRRPSSLSATLSLRDKLSEWRAICRRTGTRLLPLVWHEVALGPLRRRLQRSARA